MKLKRYKKMHDLGNGFVVISERAKNDTYGNPRYDLDIFHNGSYLKTKRVQTYNVELEIKNVVSKIER